MQMNHEHAHDGRQPAAAAPLGNLLAAIAINGVIVAFELVFGLLIGSMALVSDAVHNLSDIVAMGFSYWAEKMAGRPADSARTYGYRKIEFIAAFVNSLILSGAIALVFWQALLRLFSPPEIAGREMLLVAIIAFVGNGAATLLLQRISTGNFNLHTAWLHSLQDALFTLAVIVGAVLISLFGWRVVDPLLSVMICLFIAREIIGIVRRTVDSLLDAVPQDIDFGEVRNALLAIPGVAGVSDLHIWQTGGGQRLLSAHVISQEGSDCEAIIRAAQEMLLHEHGINHTTLQIVSDAAAPLEHCTHCN